MEDRLMDKFNGIPNQYIPSAGTQARLLLEILIDGRARNTIELTLSLKANPRSALQLLTKKYHWLIHNEGNMTGFYRLDSRHLCGDSRLDSEARVEAQIGYLGRSLGLSKRETARLPKAEVDLIRAKQKAETDQLQINL